MVMEHWLSDAGAHEVLHDRLKRLVESHEASLLDDMLSATAPPPPQQQQQQVSSPSQPLAAAASSSLGGRQAWRYLGQGDPSRAGTWDARTDLVALQVGTASAAGVATACADDRHRRESNSDNKDGTSGTDNDPTSTTTNSSSSSNPRHAHRQGIPSASASASAAVSFAQLLGPAALVSDRASPAAGGAFLRVVVGLSTAAAELSGLAADARDYFIPPLVLFGRGCAAAAARPHGDKNNPPSLPSAASPLAGSNSSGRGAASSLSSAWKPSLAEEAEILSGVAQLAQQHLQELWAWRQRSVAVAAYTLQQLAALHSAAERHTNNSNNVMIAPLSHIRYTTVWNALAELLAALASVEEVIRQNGKLQYGFRKLKKAVGQLMAISNDDGDGDGDGDDSSDNSSSSSGRTGGDNGGHGRSDDGGSTVKGMSAAVDTSTLRGLLGSLSNGGAGGGGDRRSLSELRAVLSRIETDVMLPYVSNSSSTLLAVAAKAATSDESGTDAAVGGRPLASNSSSSTSSGVSPPRQDASTSGGTVRHGRLFRREMLEATCALLASVEAGIGTPRERDAEACLLPTAALHHVCIHLFKMSTPTTTTVGPPATATPHARGCDAAAAGGNLEPAELDLCVALGGRIIALHARVPAVAIAGSSGGGSLCPSLWMARGVAPELAHAYLHGTLAITPMTAAAAAGVVSSSAAVSDTAAEVSRRVVGSLRTARRRREVDFAALVNRLTTLLSAWLAEMAALPLPGVVPPPQQQQQDRPASTPAAGSSRGFVEAAVVLIQRGLLLAGDLQHAMAALVRLSCGDDAAAVTATAAAELNGLPADCADALSHGAEVLLMVREAFHAKSGAFAGCFDVVTRSIAYVLERHLFVAHAAAAAAVLKNSINTTVSGGGGRRAEAGSSSGGGTSSRVAENTNNSNDDTTAAAVEQALLLLRGTLTSLDSLLLLSLLLDIILGNRSNSGAVNSSCCLSSEAQESAQAAFDQLGRVTAYQARLAEVTSCAFLYWHRGALVPFFFRRCYDRPNRAGRLPYLAAALGDCVAPLLLKARHTSPCSSYSLSSSWLHVLLAEYTTFVHAAMAAELLRPLCTGIEDDLRLYTHGAVLGQPFQRLESSLGNITDNNSNDYGDEGRHGIDDGVVFVKDLANFTSGLGAVPFKLLGRWCDVAASVEDHLDAQFYNLNALMPNDCKTYEEMRNLALVKYGLTVAVGGGSLPGGIVDQGLDVLVVTQGIPLFIAHYTYNMNAQLFIQRPTSTTARHLHTLHATHVANSIRTHGTGIMSTAVNHVYRCLLRKLSILSRFLADAQVHSRLLRDQKRVAAFRREHRICAIGKDSNGAGADADAGGFPFFAYPLGMAAAFNQDMQATLGLAGDGQTFVAKFARLVSEIGNALGYMRLLRSGSLRVVADSAQFLHSADADNEAVTGANQNRSSGRGPAKPKGPRGGAGGLSQYLSTVFHIGSRSSSSSSDDDDDEQEEDDFLASSDNDSDSWSDSDSDSSLHQRLRLEQHRRRRRIAAAATVERQLHRRRRRATAAAVGAVDAVAATIADKLADGSEYLSLLLAAVGSRLGLAAGLSKPSREQQDGGVNHLNNDNTSANSGATRHEHLALFPLIVPALCVGAVEEMTREKERLAKRGRDDGGDGAIFTDDGFALGCVFLLALFGREEEFQALLFFQGIRAEYEQRLRDLRAAMAAKEGTAGGGGGGMHTTTTNGNSTTTATAVPFYLADNDAEEVNSMHLTATMLALTLQEYTGLEETFVASGVFFSAEGCRSRGGGRRWRGGEDEGGDLNSEDDEGGSSLSSSSASAPSGEGSGGGCDASSDDSNSSSSDSDDD